MAEHLASIFGTEKDRVNCTFYFKIGACRHSDRCSRLHTMPSISPTLLLSNMYQRPDMITPTPGVATDPQLNAQHMDPRRIQEHYEDFYEDLFEELTKYGEIESLNICGNLANHMFGNVYVQFREEEHAANVLRNLTGRFYAGRPIIVDFSPVTDFREATFRQYEENTCNRDIEGRVGVAAHIGIGMVKIAHMERVAGRHHDGKDRYHEEWGRKPRSQSPGHRRDRSRSPTGRRNRSLVREGSEERRAMIVQWNREREHANNNNSSNRDSNGYGQNSEHCRDQLWHNQAGDTY